jgi:hypothetical protein
MFRLLKLKNMKESTKRKQRKEKERYLLWVAARQTAAGPSVWYPVQADQVGEQHLPYNYVC